MFMGPNKPHEANHRESCSRRHSGLSTCLELTGVNLNPLEQNHAKKHLSGVYNILFDAFTFVVTLVNQLEKYPINPASCDAVVQGSVGLSRRATTAACAWELEDLEIPCPPYPGRT